MYDMLGGIADDKVSLYSGFGPRVFLNTKRSGQCGIGSDLPNLNDTCVRKMRVVFCPRSC